MQPVINRDRLDAIITRIEQVIIDEELDFAEQKLLFDILSDRRADKINKVKMSDAVNNMPLGGLMKKILKTKSEDAE